MALPILQFSNNAQTTLAGSLTSTATTAQLATGTGATFPALATGQGFFGSLFDALTGKVTEIVLVTAITGDNVTIVRGQDNTTGRAWAAGDTFALYPVAGDMGAMAQQVTLVGAGYAYAADTGAANAYAVAFPSPVTALANNMTRQFLVKTTNTGASTLAIDGLAATALVGLAGTALTGGELVANGIATVTYSVPAASWILSECTPASGTVAAPTQVAPATGAKHAVQFGQVAGVVGLSRNLAITMAGGTTVSTIVADEIIVETALGGLRYALSGVNLSLDISATGANGIDTSASPVSAWVAQYVAYNPTTKVIIAFATNATAAAVTEVYSAATGLPAGFTASALVGFGLTDSTGKFIKATGDYRRMSWPVPRTLYNSATSPGTTYVASSLVNVCPKNAKRLQGTAGIAGATGSGGQYSLYTATDNTGSYAGSSLGYTASGGATSGVFDIPVITLQTAYISAPSSGGGGTFAWYSNCFNF